MINGDPSGRDRAGFGRPVVSRQRGRDAGEARVRLQAVAVVEITDLSGRQEADGEEKVDREGRFVAGVVGNILASVGEERNMVSK